MKSNIKALLKHDGKWKRKILDIGTGYFPPTWAIKDGILLNIQGTYYELRQVVRFNKQGKRIYKRRTK